MDPSSALLLHQSVWTLLLSVVLEYAKNAKWFPLLTAKTAYLNRFVAVLGSGAATLGVHVAYNHTGGVLTITGLTAAGILAAGQEWIRTFLIQEIGYQNLIRGKIAPIGLTGALPAPSTGVLPPTGIPPMPNSTAPAPPVTPAPTQ